MARHAGPANLKVELYFVKVELKGKNGRGRIEERVMPTSYYCICDFKQCKDKVSSGNANVTYLKLPADEEAGKHWLRELVSSPASRLDLLKDGWGKLLLEYSDRKSDPIKNTP